jgi:REP element-mobilizing transposase RayT
MPNDPINPKRRSIRLPEYDYTQQGAYFITICSHLKKHIFGEITSGSMKLSPVGEIAHYQWHQLPQHFNNIELDTFIIMPNHIHGILIITKPQQPITRRDSPDLSNEDTPQVSTLTPFPPSNYKQPHGAVPGSVGAIIQNYKSRTSRKINTLLRSKINPIWQRNFYEHIIRDETDYERIVEYIENNPISWSDDKYYSN